MNMNTPGKQNGESSPLNTTTTFNQNHLNTPTSSQNTSHPLASSNSLIRFIVGPSQTPFDVQFLPVIQHSAPFAHTIVQQHKPTPNIYLPAVSADDFTVLRTWLHDRKPPAFEKAHELKDLCRLWIAAGKAGMWRQMNTLMRLGMELMKPKSFEVDIDTVKYVYDNTPTGSNLRDYIIAIFCQRSTVQKRFFTPEYESLGILRDAAAFHKILDKVRERNPVGKDGYDLERLEIRWNMYGGGMPFLHYLLTMERDVDWSRVEYVLPEHLVFGKNAEDLPDAFFLNDKEVLELAEDVVKQL